MCYHPQESMKNVKTHDYTHHTRQHLHAAIHAGAIRGKHKKRSAKGCHRGSISTHTHEHHHKVNKLKTTNQPTTTNNVQVPPCIVCISTERARTALPNFEWFVCLLENFIGAKILFDSFVFQGGKCCVRV